MAETSNIAPRRVSGIQVNTAWTALFHRTAIFSSGWRRLAHRRGPMRAPAHACVCCRGLGPQRAVQPQAAIGYRLHALPLKTLFRDAATTRRTMFLIPALRGVELE
jgi:hypothetical protein